VNNFREKVNLIWEIADLLRGDYRPREYVDVILPMTVFYRLDLAIAGTRDAVREAHNKYSVRLENSDALLASIAGGLVYNTSEFDWQKLLQAPDDLAQNFIHYLNGYSPEVQDIIEKFDFRRQVSRLQSSKLIYPIMQRLLQVDLHPDRVKNHEMGYIFEELIRKFSEQYNETAGEHFTPREVIRLMVELIFSEDDEVLHVPHKISKVYDPACGTGGMLTIAKDYITAKERNPDATVLLFGQELNPSAYAVAKSDMLLKGEDPDNIIFGNSFSDDGYRGQHFNIMLSNPPFGVSWKKVEWIIKQEYERQGMDGRFGAGLPRINDGALLFLQHILSKMDNEEGSRIAIIFNGSPLFTGDAGSGESEIRRWILENDWLEGIVALPDQLFYNTGINTYIWVLSNRKSEKRKGKVQLVNAVDFYQKMRKSMGSKRHEIKYPNEEEPNALDQIGMIARIYRNFDGPTFAVPGSLLNEKEKEEEYLSNDFNRIYANHFFGYRKVRIDRPLRLNFQATPERIERIEEQSAFKNLAVSKKKDPKAREADEAVGKEQQAAIRALLGNLPEGLLNDRAEFLKLLRRAARQHQVKLTASLTNAIVAALGETDPTANICFDKNDKPEPDNALRDYESIPLPEEEELASYTPGESWLDEKVPLTEDVWDYFRREVQPHVEDAYIDASFIDDKDGKVGRVGYEISFTRYFYRYQPPRDLAVIEDDIRTLEREIIDLLSQVGGNGMRV